MPKDLYDGNWSLWGDFRVILSERSESKDPYPHVREGARGPLAAKENEFFDFAGKFFEFSCFTQNNIAVSTAQQNPIYQRTDSLKKPLSPWG